MADISEVIDRIHGQIAAAADAERDHVCPRCGGCALCRALCRQCDGRGVV